MLASPGGAGGLPIYAAQLSSLRVRRALRKSSQGTPLLHHFALHRAARDPITLAQARPGAEARVLHNAGVLGSATPADLQRGCTFALDDRSGLAVQLVEERVQVWWNGRPLEEVTIATRPGMKPVRVLCSRSALVFGLLSPPVAVLAFPATVTSFFLWPMILCIGAGFPLIACFLHIAHALQDHPWKWVAFGLAPLTLLEIACLVALPTPIGSAPAPPLEMLFDVAILFLLPWLGPLVCLRGQKKVGGSDDPTAKAGGL